MTITRVVAITGCDSGLGWALAARMGREGVATIAGMLRPESEAARALAKYCVMPCQLDVTSADSVAGFKGFVNQVVKENPGYKLYAVVNNAGVMTIGDYEWQTPSIIHNTIDVNLLGAMRVVTEFLPDLRAAAAGVRSATIDGDVPNPRIINIVSHCGLQPLPGMATYSASKAGLIAWTRALRYELRDYGVKTVAFIPGGFIGSSSLLENQATSTNEMLQNLNEDQKLIYETRIKSLSEYLSKAAHDTRYDSLKDESIIETFMKLLNEECPGEMYKVENFRYKVYYSLMKLPLPEFVLHWIVKRFLNFPE